MVWMGLEILLLASNLGRNIMHLDENCLMRVMRTTLPPQAQAALIKYPHFFWSCINVNKTIAIVYIEIYLPLWFLLLQTCPFLVAQSGLFDHWDNIIIIIIIIISLVSLQVPPSNPSWSSALCVSNKSNLGQLPSFLHLPASHSLWVQEPVSFSKVNLQWWNL